MAYRLEDIELTRPISDIHLTIEETGVGALIRRKGRPIGFLMKAFPRARAVPAEVLKSWIASELKDTLMAEAIREELAPSSPTMPLPTLTVAICTHARPALVQRCIQSLLPLRARHGFEILVVDNATPDSSVADAVTRYAGARYAREELAGLDFARNRAWKEARGEWVAYLDDDVIVDAGWFDGFREALRENPDAVAVTGLVAPLTLATEAQIIFEYRGGFRHGCDTHRYRAELPGNDCYPCGSGLLGVGANMAYRRDTLQKLGGFDEALDTGAPLPGGGDLDMFYRVVHSGGILVYEPRFLVFHEHRTTLAALRRQYYTWGLGLMAYIRKHIEAGSSERLKFYRLSKWWIRDELQQLRNALRGRGHVPAGMIVSELLGATVGWFGEYSRSRKRIEALKNSAS